jgi:mediator of RNA polymerase II transcription subunit 18, fungi type
MPDFKSLKPIDPSGSYVLEAKIRVQDLNTPNIVDSGVQELKRFKNQLKGCVDLNVPDRLKLDTRIKYKAPTIAQPVGRPIQTAR